MLLRSELARTGLKRQRRRGRIVKVLGLMKIDHNGRPALPRQLGAFVQHLTRNDLLVPINHSAYVDELLRKTLT